jgi:predicted dehydrogenase
LGEEPLWVTAQYGETIDKEKFKDVEETVSWQMQFPSGAIVNGFSSYRSNIEQLYVSANKGFMELSPAYSYGPLKGKTQEGDMKLPIVHHQTIMLEEICKEFLATKTFPKHIDGEEGLRDMKILMSIYEAAQTGKRISLV